MDPVTLGVVALMGAVATIGGAAEDLESDIGSQSNPNSQVQLAPQMGHLHRMINKAASGEPVAYGVWCGVAGAIAYLVMSMGLMPIIAFCSRYLYCYIPYGKDCWSISIRTTIIYGCINTIIRTNCWSRIYN